MASQLKPVAFNVSIPCQHCKTKLYLTVSAHLGPVYGHIGYAVLDCPNCLGQIRAQTPGDILSEPYTVSGYGSKSNVPCKKCGRKIYFSSAKAFLRNGEKHVELMCNSPACANTGIYNEVELEIRGD
jgi:hypothetical protein